MSQIKSKVLLDAPSVSTVLLANFKAKESQDEPASGYIMYHVYVSLLVGVLHQLLASECHLSSMKLLGQHVKEQSIKCNCFIFRIQVIIRNSAETNSMIYQNRWYKLVSYYLAVTSMFVFDVPKTHFLECTPQYKILQKLQ